MIYLFLWLILGAQQEGVITMEEVGLKLTFTSEWQTKTEGAAPFAAVAEFIPKKALAMIAREHQDPNEPLDQSKRELLDSLKHSFSEYSIISEETFTTPGGLETTVLAIELKARDMTLRHLTYLFSGFGERFSVTFATKADIYPELEPEFKKIMKTLELNGPKEQDLEFVKVAMAKTTDYAALEKLLAQGANINAVNRKGHSMLTMAVVDRKGLLVKWLLDHGADLNHPRNNTSFMGVVASPPIRELLDRKLGQFTPPRKPKDLTPEWRSPEAAVFFGINNIQLDYVKQGLEMGANLKALDDNYQLPPLAFTRQLMKEFEELGLDGSKLKPIEAALAAASGEKI